MFRNIANSTQNNIPPLHPFLSASVRNLLLCYLSESTAYDNNCKAVKIYQFRSEVCSWLHKGTRGVCEAVIAQGFFL